MDNATVVRSTCELCNAGCGELVYMEEGKPVRVEGDPDNPINKGAICIKGTASLEYLCHPDRVKYPLKRVGEKGEGKWQQIAWDEALVHIHTETASKLGIKEGDWVYIETKRGKIKQKAALTSNIDPRVVIVGYGWWFPEKDSELHGWAESNINILTDNKPPYAREMGSATLRGILCKVYKAS